MKALLLVVILSIPLVFIAGCINQNGTPERFRAGLDHTEEITNQTGTSVQLIDIGNHLLDDNVYFQELEVNANQSYVNMHFLRIEDSTAVDWNDLFESNEEQFHVGYNQYFKLKVNQTVELEGTPYKIKLLNITGFGCPKGMQC